MIKYVNNLKTPIKCLKNYQRHYFFLVFYDKSTSKFFHLLVPYPNANYLKKQPNPPPSKKQNNK